MENNGMYMDVSNIRRVVTKADGSFDRIATTDEILVVIRGKTYPHKEEIKAAGFRFYGAEKDWRKIVDRSQHLEFLKATIEQFGFTPYNVSYAVKDADK